MQPFSYKLYTQEDIPHHKIWEFSLHFENKGSHFLGM